MLLDLFVSGRPLLFAPKWETTSLRVLPEWLAVTLSRIPSMRKSLKDAYCNEFEATQRFNSRECHCLWLRVLAGGLSCQTGLTHDAAFGLLTSAA